MYWPVADTATYFHKFEIGGGKVARVNDDPVSDEMYAWPPSTAAMYFPGAATVVDMATDVHCTPDCPAGVVSSVHVEPPSLDSQRS